MAPCFYHYNLLKETLLSTTSSSNSHMTDIFYTDASISLINNAKICGGNIELRCTLLGLRIGAGSKNILPPCNGIKYLQNYDD